MLVTLLPNIKYGKALRSLADKELQQQCEDAWELFQEVSDTQNPLQLSYPARGWLGCEYQLGIYAAMACSVWRIERYHNSGPWAEVASLLAEWEPDHEKPKWLGDLTVHRSHRSYLLRNRHVVYCEAWPNTPELMPIVYPQPTRHDARGYKLRITELDERAIRSGKLAFPDGLHYDFNKREVIEDDGEDESNGESPKQG